MKIKTIAMAFFYCLIYSSHCYSYSNFYGYLSLNYQKSRIYNENNYTFSQVMNMNLSDDLWNKNKLLASLYVQRHESDSQPWSEFVPNFNVSLSGYKYSAIFKYSPFKTHGIGYDLFNRRFSSNFSITPEVFPRLNVSYNQNHEFDNLQKRKMDNTSRYWYLFTDWNHTFISLRANYLIQKKIDNLSAAETYNYSSGSSGVRMNFNLPFESSSAWEYIFSMSRQKSFSMKSDKTYTHNISSNFSGAPVSFCRWSVNYIGRIFDRNTGIFSSAYSTHSINSDINANISKKLEVSFDRNYTISKISSIREETDDLSLQTSLRQLEVTGRINSTISLRRSIFLKSIAGKYSTNLLYFFSTLKFYQDNECQFNLTVNYNDHIIYTESKYRVVKYVNILTYPKENIRMNVSYQTTFTGQKAAFLNDNIENFRLDFLLNLKGNSVFRFGYLSDKYKLAGIPDIYSLLMEVSYPYRQKVTFHSSLSHKWVKDFTQQTTSRSADVFSSEMSLFVTKKTRLTMAFSMTHEPGQNSIENVSFNLNQQF